MTYKCTNVCRNYKIGGDNYVGTPRSCTNPQFILKYCMNCKVYFDTEQNRCECCKTSLRVGLRNKYKPKITRAI